MRLLTRRTTVLILFACAIHSCIPEDLEEATRTLQQTASKNVCTLIPDENLESAWEFASSESPKATGMIIYQNGVRRFERYNLANACPSVLSFFCRFLPPLRWLLLDVFDPFPFGGSSTRPFSLFSMTKSIAGLTAVLLEEQGLISSLDETVSTYIPEWVNEDGKSSITVRELLSLSSGVDATVQGPNDVTLEDGLNVPLLDGAPRFDYGAEPFTVVSQLLKAATGDGGQDAISFLREHLFVPLGISIELERTNDDAEIPILSTGGQATLRDVATLGLELLAAVDGSGQVLSQQAMAKLMIPGLNPTYGLGFWLNADGIAVDGTSFPPTYPQCNDNNAVVFHMLGLGGQALTVVPNHALVMVKSATIGFNEPPLEGLWDALFRGLQCQCN